MASSPSDAGEPQSQSDELRRVLCNRWAHLLLSVVAAVQVVAVSLFAIEFLPALSHTESLLLGETIFTALKWLTVAVFVVSSGTVTLGMLGYLLEVDPKSRKMPWMLAFLVTGGLGSAIYCLSVYRKQAAALG